MGGSPAIGLPGTLDELARQQQPAATAAAVTVEPTCDADLRIVAGDPLRLQQMAVAVIPACDAGR